MLAVISNLAALYTQDSSDEVVWKTVSEVELLVLNLTQKVWLKIDVILRALDAPD
jgi:hypothetical protein